eukprot:191969-Rhodomonas_salina.1
MVCIPSPPHSPASAPSSAASAPTSRLLSLFPALSSSSPSSSSFVIVASTVETPFTPLLANLCTCFTRSDVTSVSRFCTELASSVSRPRTSFTFSTFLLRISIRWSPTEFITSGTAPPPMPRVSTNPAITTLAAPLVD